MLHTLVELGWVSPRMADALRELDSILDGMSGASMKHLWTADALESAPEWELVRAQAQEILIHLTTDASLSDSS